MATPLTGKEALVALINSANGTNFTVDDLSFSDLVTNDGPLNTSVLVTAAPSSGYSGSVRVNYSRLDGDEVLPPRGYPFETEVVYEGETHWRQMIPKINERFNLKLTDEDIGADQLVDVKGPLPQEAWIEFVDDVANATPHAWNGYLTMTLVDQSGGTEYPIMDWNVELGNRFRDYTGDQLVYNDDPSNPNGRTDGWFARLTEAPAVAFDSLSPIIAWRAYDLDRGPADAEFNPDDNTHAYHFGGANPDAGIPSFLDIIAGLPNLGYDDSDPHPDRDFMRQSTFEIEFSAQDPNGAYRVFYYLNSVYDPGDGGFTRLVGPTGNFGPGGDVIVETALEYNVRSPGGGSYSYIAARIPLQEIYGLIRGTSFWDGTSPITLSATMRLYDSTDDAISYGEVNNATMISELDTYAPNQIVGRNGFALAASNRMFLVDQFNEGVEVTDESVPTGFEVMVAGRNGEIWAFKNDPSGLRMAYSDDRGETGTWSQTQFAEGTSIEPAEAVFFKGNIYANIRQLTFGVVQTRVCRLVYHGETGWWWEPVFELPRQSNATSFAADDETMVWVVNNELHITNDGVAFARESLKQITWNGQTVSLSNHAPAIRNGQIVGTARGTGDYWNNRTMTFVRRGANDYVFDEPMFYPKSANENYSRSGRVNTFVVGNRWFIVLQTSVKTGGTWSEPVHGAIWYTDIIYPSTVDDWTCAVANSDMVEQTFAYDGTRILLAGKAYGSASSGWAGISTDGGANWQFDSNFGSAFGMLRNEAYLAVQRVNDEVDYPPIADKPAFTGELRGQPTNLTDGSKCNQVIGLTTGGFAVVGDWLKTDKPEIERDGVFIYDEYGYLDSNFDCAFTRGHLEYGNNTYDAGNYVDWHVVSGIADTGSNLVVVGNFTEVNGQPKNGIAWLNRATGALVELPAHTWTTAASMPAYLKTVAYDSATSKIYVGGTFTSVDGHATVGVARLNSDGTLDTSFSSAITSTDPVRLIVNLLQPWVDGTVLVSGVFDGDRSVLLDGSGAIVTGFPLSSGVVHSAFVDSDGGLAMAGYGLNGGTVVKITKAGSVYTVDSSFMVNLITDGNVGYLVGRVPDSGPYLFQQHTFTQGSINFNRPYFCNSSGNEMEGYANLYTWESLAEASGSRMALDAVGGGQVLMTGQFRTVYQAGYPRAESAVRRNIALFRPVDFNPPS